MDPRGPAEGGEGDSLKPDSSLPDPCSSPHSGTSCALTGPYASWPSLCTWWGCCSEPWCSATSQTGQSWVGSRGWAGIRGSAGLRGSRWELGIASRGWFENLQHQSPNTTEVRKIPQPRHDPVRALLSWLSLAPISLQGPVTGLPSSHRLGRRKVLILNYLQTAVSGTCAAFAPNFPIYCAFRLLSGMSLAGIALNCMTLSERRLPAHSPLATQPSNPFPASPPSLPLLSPACPPASLLGLTFLPIEQLSLRLMPP